MRPLPTRGGIPPAETHPARRCVREHFRLRKGLAPSGAPFPLVEGGQGSQRKGTTPFAFSRPRSEVHSGQTPVARSELTLDRYFQAPPVTPIWDRRCGWVISGGGVTHPLPGELADPLDGVQVGRV